MSTPIRFDRAEVRALVLSTLGEVLSQRSGHPVNSLGDSTCLIGRESVLDSLGLVTLILDVEQKLQDEYDLSLALTDERAMSQKNSPYRTVRSLLDYIFSLTEETQSLDRA